MENVQRLLQQLQQTGGQLIDPGNTDAPVLGPIRQANFAMFGRPAYADQSLPMGERGMDAIMRYSPVLGASSTKGLSGVKGYSPQAIGRAAKTMKGTSGRLDPQDVDIIGKFGELVEMRKGKGNLGDTGETIQSLVTNLFGKKAANLPNKDIKTLLDQVVMKAQMGGSYGR